MEKSNSFIIGKDKIPSWFDEQCKKGKARIFYDDEENIKLIKIISPGTEYELNVGDKIILNKHGMVGIKKPSAEE